ncbi:MAG: DcaP family trimeric outer membrane transporter [Alphaproteobacteria bacterium]|nr:DcaP family trimeric outer membrane transporter [Alphaproteobacteria bacterium]
MEAGSKPRSWKLPGSNTSMAIGGFAKLDLIYDINAATGDLSTPMLPADGTAAAGRQGHFRLHARESRLWIKTWTPTDWGELATHIEGDFFGAGGNQVVSNSHSLRIRHAYGRLGPVLAGQTASTFGDASAYPQLLDFRKAFGRTFILQGVVRYTHNFGGGTTLALAVENPELAFSRTSAVAAGAAVAHDPLPDFILRFRHAWAAGHIQLSGLLRRFKVDSGLGGVTPNSDERDVFGWGVHISGVWRITRRDAVGGAFKAGRGVGRYIQNNGDADYFFTPTGGLAGVATAPNDLFALTMAYGGYAWYRHHWTPALRSTLAFGMIWWGDLGPKSGFPATPLGPVSSFPHYARSLHANLIWSPVKRVNIGVEYGYFFTAYINQANAKGHRIQFSFQYFY